MFIPVLAYSLHRISPVYVLSNLGAVPLTLQLLRA